MRGLGWWRLQGIICENYVDLTFAGQCNVVEALRKEVKMAIYAKLMGNPFVDAGVSAICEWLGENSAPRYYD